MGARIVTVIGEIEAVDAVSLRLEHRTFVATPELLERASALRAQPVRVMVLDVDPPRLVRIDPVDAPLGGTPEQRWDAISETWADTFAELAK
ncbi:hypothetical protein [Sandaracinus amylolyticus]|uniref:hypothetical protein n=1 Tax=Sandaracinus amylolyticus TaxID=927083 RepID=UPI001F19DA00|nr:hypothetical protein [Sandaracinus amylolyticus]UJR82825.1 Hypothetical protein I5071_48900 [Sandaracinus amylolyticus]